MKKFTTSILLRFTDCLTLFTVAAFLFLAAAIAGSQTQPIVPGNDRGLFVVEDALAQFNALKHHAEALGWRNPESLGAPDPSLFDHYQGLARNPRTGSPVFYVSQLDDDDGGTAGGYLHVVRFASRTTSGERLRSNLQQIGNDTEEAYPPNFDTWLRSIRFDGTLSFDGVLLPTYKHPGSMALVDDVLFVPVDQPTSEGNPTGQLLLFDVLADPANPVPLQALALDHSIDNLAVTLVGDGVYRIWTNGDGGNDINVYDTTGTDLRDDALELTLVLSWDPSTVASWPTGTGAHQSSTFLRETDGTLYLIGMRGTSPFAGSDFADLYRVDESVPDKLTLTHLRTREFNCVYDGGGGQVDMRVCNMTASNNAYVSPTGELILYSIPHDDEDGFDPDIVRMGEFRHRDVNREGSPLRSPTADAMGPYQVDEGDVVKLLGFGGPPADRPWVELYDDDSFRDRSIVVDYDDRSLLELNEFDSLDDFTDKTSSVRWRSPDGLDIELYDDDDFSDRYIVLRGTGNTESITNIGSQKVVTGLVEHFNPSKSDDEKLEFNDKTSSLQFDGTVPTHGDVNLEWDLDEDDKYGETGDQATQGDEVGKSPTFDASDLDGPTEVTVTLHSTVSGVSRTGTDITIIEVKNLAPVVQIDSFEGGIGDIALTMVPVTLTGSFEDVAADTHTATVDWDDWSSSAALVNDAADTTTASHTYSSGGNLTVELTITDDDNGHGSSAAQLTVYDPIAATDASIDRIDELLKTVTDPEIEAALRLARDWLDGNNLGVDNNGALDHLNSGDLEAALYKIEKTLKALEQAEGAGAGNLLEIKKLLLLTAQSLVHKAYQDAQDAIGSPSKGEQKQLERINQLIQDGQTLFENQEYLEAIYKYQEALRRSLALIDELPEG